MYSLFPLVFSLLFCTKMISCFHRIYQLKRSGRTIAAMMQQDRNRGLLLDVDVKNSDFFTTQLNLATTNKLLKDEIYIYNMLNDDAVENLSTVEETLQQIVQKANCFMRSNKLWNRDKFQHVLKDIINGEGIFACVLGGKNTGKSFVIEEMERLEEKVFLVDLRRNSDILSSLVENLKERQLRFKLTDFNNALVKVITGIVLKWTDDNVKNVISQADYLKIVDALIKKPAALASVLQDLSTGFGGITLIVDEANIALTITDSTPEAKIVATKEALAILTRLTKQKKAVR